VRVYGGVPGWFAHANGNLIASKLTRLYLVASPEYDQPGGVDGAAEAADGAIEAIIADLGLDYDSLPAQVIMSLAAALANVMLPCDEHGITCWLEQIDADIEDTELLLVQGEMADADQWPTEWPTGEAEP
jgi:hypothetical protein